MVENYALVQRPAAFSWEAMTLLTGAVQATAAIQVDFPRPVTIVSVYPSVALAGGNNALLFPSLDDILVRIEVDTGSERRLTSRFDSTQPNGVNNFPDVTLGSYRDTVGGARVLDLQIGAPDGGRPTLNCTFTWKRPIAGGPWFQDVYVGMVFHTQYKA